MERRPASGVAAAGRQGRRADLARGGARDRSEGGRARPCVEDAVRFVDWYARTSHIASGCGESQALCDKQRVRIRCSGRRTVSCGVVTLFLLQHFHFLQHLYRRFL